ncbi:MAG TPA: MBL fold metallo-hydrolase [Pyrinomonadaceae bacterium]|jgi:glyoxylase-like metal-dependent hydrolase (beta-lactamase superfamily II)|nr:MBL fold metallo-hydrolase [Pyrinomonadaceae bacterium]
MYFKQFYLGCLAHASYLIGSEGEAAVVDPQRDVEQYLEEAARQGLAIKYVVETHLHADFVSGHRELASRAGAEIVIGRRAGATFSHRAVGEGDEIGVGKVTLRFLETPGHTPEGISILVTDHEVSGEPQKVLTGDTLFVGDVGRPDLAGSRGYTSEAMAAMLYESLHGKLLKLDDAVEVFPAHGAGSMCGRNISEETSSTIGQQRRLNYALAPMPEGEFVRMMTTDLPPAPSYFSRDAEINRAGAPALADVPRPRALSPRELRSLQGEGRLVLDVRAAAEFGAGHVPGALNVGLGGQFAIWAANLIEPERKIIVVADGEEKVGEAVTRLARVGLETVEGFLSGGMEAWRESGLEVASVTQISVVDLHRLMEAGDGLQVLDVRRPAEFADGHVPRAVPAPLAGLRQHALEGLDPSRPLAVICAGGYRSSVATSLLLTRGFKKIFNVAGGTSAYVGAGYAVEK